MPTFSREKNVKVFTEMQHEFGLMILENIEINSSNLYYIVQNVAKLNSNSGGP